MARFGPDKLPIVCVLVLLAFLACLMVPVASGFKVKQNVDCNVLGEGSHENPKYCSVIRGDDTPHDMPCCTVAISQKQVEPFLQSRVQLENDGKISIFIDEESGGRINEQILVPLVAPHKYQIEFELRAQYRNGTYCFNSREQAEILEKRGNILPNGTFKKMFQGYVTFAYSRYGPGTPESKAEGCNNSLCRNFVFAGPDVFLGDLLTKSLVTIRNHPHPHYRYDVDRPVDGGIQTFLWRRFYEFNQNDTCPLALRELKSLGYYLPFRVTKPEIIGYDRSELYPPSEEFTGKFSVTPVKKKKPELHPYSEWAGRYFAAKCPWKITFGNKYGLLVSPFTY